MANELNIVLAESGATVTCQPYQAGVAVGSPISLTEIGTSAVYSGNMTGSAGTYILAFNDGTENVGVGSIVWSGSAEVPVSTLTSGDLPSVPTASDNATAVRAELTELANLDASVSSRLAGSSYTAPTTPPTAAEITTAVWSAADKTGYSLTSAERTAIAAAVESSILNEADGQAVLNALVSAIGNTNLSEVSLVAAVRADLERNGGKLDNIPTTAAPSASAVASATRTELSTELSRIDQSISSRLASADYTAPTAAPTAAQNASAVRTELSTELARIDAPISGATAPSAATVASAVRTELSTELGRVDAAVSTRLASSAATDLAAVKAKTDLLNTDRLANVATTNIVGTLLAQSQS